MPAEHQAFEDAVDGVPVSSGNVSLGRPPKGQSPLAAMYATHRNVNVHVDMRWLSLDKALLEFPPGLGQTTSRSSSSGSRSRSSSNHLSGERVAFGRQLLSDASDDACVWVLCAQISELSFLDEHAVATTTGNEVFIEVEYGDNAWCLKGQSRHIESSVASSTVAVSSAVAFPWRSDFAAKMKLRLVAKGHCYGMKLPGLLSSSRTLAECSWELRFASEGRGLHQSLQLAMTDKAGHDVACVRTVCELRRIPLGKLRRGGARLGRAVVQTNMATWSGTWEVKGRPLACTSGRMEASVPPRAASRAPRSASPQREEQPVEDNYSRVDTPAPEAGGTSFHGTGGTRASARRVLYFDL
mmetsp:Transcript_7688/g.16904  ORF Transcript_7688/g.16904 Transcript_7688/m.16904 type:complete len:355 (-) Transcript_7688:93-1157(-)